MLSETRQLAQRLATTALGGAPVYHYAGPSANAEPLYGVVAVESVNPDYDMPTGRPLPSWFAEWTLSVHALTADRCELAAGQAVGALPGTLVGDGVRARDVAVTEMTGIELAPDTGVWIADISVQMAVLRG